MPVPEDFTFLLSVLILMIKLVVSPHQMLLFKEPKLKTWIIFDERWKRPFVAKSTNKLADSQRSESTFAAPFQF